MYRVIKPRGTGKTKELMMRAITESTYPVILCSNPIAMKRKAEAYGIIGIDFKGYDEFHSLTDDTNYYIDELELFIKYYFNETGILKGYTLTNED